MLTKTVRIQVLVFIIVALLGVTYVGANYIGLFSWIGGRGYTVKAQFTDSGGIFTHAEVTYRGVPIGRVGDLRLIDGGVEVDLDIESGAPEVPSDVKAVVTNRSAAGEQFVDLQPRNNKAPFLADGSVIDKKSTALPLGVETVMLNLDKLMESVPTDSMRTLVDELYDATQGSGPDLQILLDTASSFTKSASDHLPSTLQLITDAKTVLTTQMQQLGSIRQFAANMDQIALQLKKSDGDIRGLLVSVPGVSRQIIEVLQESGANLGTVLGNLLVTANVFGANNRNSLEQMLSLAPQLVNVGQSVIKPDGAHFGLLTTYFDPLPCVAGYGTTLRNGTDVSSKPLNTDAKCTTSPASGTGVRGSQNAPGGR